MAGDFAGLGDVLPAELVINILDLFGFDSRSLFADTL